MIGFSLRISELKEGVSTGLVQEACDLDYPAAVDCLRERLQGERIFSTQTLNPWGSVLDLISYLERGKGQGDLLYGGGYPYLFTAQGADIIDHIGSGPQSHHCELEDILDPEAIYLLESWDQS